MINHDHIYQRALQLLHQNRLIEADGLFRQTLTLNPRHACAKHFLGISAFRQGRVQDAYRLTRESLDLEDSAPFLANFGAICRALNLNDEAEKALLRSLAKNPRAAASHNNLGNLYADLGRLPEAVAAFRKALEIDPAHPNTRFNLAKTLAQFGSSADAFAEFRRELALRPNPTAHSDLCLYLHYDPTQTADSIFAEHQRWASLYTQPLPRPPVRDPQPGRKLRLGYVSPNFYEHAAAHLLLPLIQHHDKNNFQIHLYSTMTSAKDALTSHFESLTHQFIPCAGLTPRQLAARIQADQIDILIDCANHTTGNSLLAFALRPAPLQFTMIGHPSTTGLSAIDFRITDSSFDPPDSPLPSAEQSIRLDPAAWCYHPGENIPDVATLPALKNNFITFGSLSNLIKSGEASIQLWSHVLQAVANSRLMLVAAPLEGYTGAPPQKILDLFAAQNIPPERLLLIPRFPRQQYFGQYAQIDIALDTFPFHGGLTTLDALYMGVPVISLVGTTYASRTAVSLLTNAGLPRLLAESPDQFTQIAASLASNLPQLQTLRRSLRSQLQQSPLMNGPAYAQRLEKIYREKWSAL